MGDVVQIRFDKIPSFLGLPISDLEDLAPNQVAIAGYFCDNLDKTFAGQRYLARQLRYVSRSKAVPLNATDLGDLNVFPLEICTTRCSSRSPRPRRSRSHRSSCGRSRARTQALDDQCPSGHGSCGLLLCPCP